ncbi:MAG: glycosyltransferase family 39 protein [Halobacteriaceae archaeon]
MVPDRVRTPLAAVLLALPVAGVLAALEARSEGYWGDELWTVRYARTPTAALFGAIAQDVHPPLYYALANVWVDLAGVSPLGLRLPSIAAGLATLPLTYRLGARTYDRPTGAVAVALGALSVPLLIYAAEARMYALLAALTAASWLALWRLLYGPRSRWTAAAWVLAGAAMLYTHLYGIFLLAGQVVAVAALAAAGRVERPRRDPGRVFGLGTVAGVLALPWLWRLASVALGVADLEHAYVGWIARADAGYLHLFAWLGRPYPTAVLAALCALAVVRVRWTGTGSHALQRPPVRLEVQDVTPALFFGGLFAGTLALVAVASHLVRPVYYYRFCVPLLPAILVPAGSGLVGMRPRPIAAVVLAALLAVGGAGAATLVTTQGHEPLDELTAASGDATLPVTENGGTRPLPPADAVYVEYWGDEVRALYAGPDRPPVVSSLPRAVREYGRVRVVVSEERELYASEPSWTVTWHTRVRTDGPYRSYYEGDERVWWVGVVERTR